MIFIYLNTSIFILLSALHFYWMFGGKSGMQSVLPDLENGKTMRPSQFATAVVAIGLLVFAFICFGMSGNFSNVIPFKFFTIGNYCIAAIFLLRAIGDFKYVGLFRKIKNTTFGVTDKKYFTPLCILIFIDYILIFLLS